MISTELTARDHDGCLIVLLCGELDVIDAADVGAMLTAAVADHPRVVIDLAGLGHIDCCALGALSRARSQARRAGGDLALAAPSARVRRVIDLAATFTDFTVFASADEATRAVGWPGARTRAACTVTM